MLPWLALLLVVAAGCTRRFFRERADRDVESVIDEKNVDPRWAVENWYVYPDGRSRFVDVDKPDHPRKPPDDPAAAALSPNPQPIRSHFGRKYDQEGAGYLEFLEHCNQLNRTARAQMPEDSPAARLVDPTRPSDPTGYASGQQSVDRVLKSDEAPFLITLEQSLELSLFNSRDYHDRREDLYLAALPVTLERFNFATQFGLGTAAIRDWAATGARGAGDPAQSWLVNSNASVSQLFPTGAALIARLANQLVIDLGNGSGPAVSLSNFTLGITQPFLQGGGWAVTLEPLTQAERNMLYGMRSYARFRKLFYVYMAGGADQFNSPYSLAGLNLRGVGPSLNAPSQGYLPTLLTAAQERNERENLRNLTGFLELFREYQGKGDFSELQVGQVEQQLLRGQSTLLQRQQELQTGLDSFKLQLGVPTRLPIELDDAPLAPVRTTLSEFEKARDEFNALRDQADRYRNEVRGPLEALAGSTVAMMPIRVKLRSAIEGLMFDSPFAKKTKVFRETMPTRWGRWKALPNQQVEFELQRLETEQRTLLVRQAAMERNGERLTPEESARLEAIPKDIGVGQLEQSLRAYEAVQAGKPGAERNADIQYDSVVNAFVKVFSEARDERRDQVRQAWPKLPSIAVDGEDLLAADLDRANTVAAQAALTDRLELMNSRAQLNDAWRRIAVQANSLLGTFNVGYNYTTTSTPNANEPLTLGGVRSRHQLVLTGELPLVRRAERNNYRVALIAYQRARRNVQATEDFILNDIRNDIRNLRVLAENYRIERRAVEVAFDQVENALDVLQSPPTPDGAAGQPGRAAAQGQQQAANAASLTQQLLNAQSSLLAAQNRLYTVWVNYLVARMTFYRDLERMPLDPRGVWIDEPLSSSEQRPATVSSGGAGESAPGGFAELREPRGN